MITRSKAKNIMADQKIVEVVESAEDSSPSVDESQCREGNIWDIVTPSEGGTFEIGARGQQGSSTEEEATPPPESEIPRVANGDQAESPTQMSDMEKMLMIMQSIKEENRATREASEKTNASIKSMKEEIKAIRNDNKAVLEEFRKEIREDAARRDARLRYEMQEIKKGISTEVNVIREESEKTKAEMIEQHEVINQLKVEVANTSKKLVTNTQKLSDNLNRVNTELRIDIRSTKEETTKVIKGQGELQEQVRRLEAEKKKILEDMATEQEMVRRRFGEVEGRSAPRGYALDTVKDVTFNGINDYPMEFLQELREVKETYYPSEDIRWIGRHLIDEARIWWRMVRHQVHDFAQFEEKFTDKYWGEHTQESIRDRLEYGRYNRDRHISMVSYMERMILQCRQLVPPIADKHLIKKLSKHFPRNVGVAVMIRGIREIPQFESLLYECENINYSRDYENTYKNNNDGYVKVKQEKGNGAESVTDQRTQQDKRGHKFYPKQYVDKTLAIPGPSNAGQHSKNSETNAGGGARQ